MAMCTYCPAFPSVIKPIFTVLRLLKSPALERFLERLARRGPEVRLNRVMHCDPRKEILRHLALGVVKDRQCVVKHNLVRRQAGLLVD